jgi:hypothetical protein
VIILSTKAALEEINSLIQISINEEVKKIQVDGKLNKEEKKELIKKLLSNDL